ncbi:hypothetical protein Taro_015880 [Colocasia esculenta]|uniref:Uncharacterized protein n=1 Tax=Colocasia esculenta TaxID=4460 RepID=A0A843UUN1_COLES|nr:hypothetical protein [Colocasia esculenta]
MSLQILSTLNSFQNAYSFNHHRFDGKAAILLQLPYLLVFLGQLVNGNVYIHNLSKTEWITSVSSHNRSQPSGYPLLHARSYGVSHGLGSGTATTIPWSSCVSTTWHPSRECLLRTLDLEFLVSTYLSSYDGGGSLSSHSCAMLTSHSEEHESISSSRWDAGSIRPAFARALRRVWPVSPTTSRFLPSGSMANSFTIRSDTFAEPVVAPPGWDTAEAHKRAKDLAQGEREGSLRRVAIAMALGFPLLLNPLISGRSVGCFPREEDGGICNNPS